MKHALILFVMLAAAGIVSGCKSSSPGTSGPRPIPTSSNRAGLYFLAFGDDFTVGIGTIFCGNVNSGPCSTTPTQPGVGVATNPTGWAQRLAGFLTLPRYQPFTYVGLGVYGALSGSAPLPEGSGGDVQANNGQMGSLTTLATTARSANIRLLIIVQSGINDVLDAFYSAQCVANGGKVVGGGNASLSQPCTASNTSLADGSGNVRNSTLYNAFRSMLGNINNIAGSPPEATLIVGVPDVGAIPAFAQFSAAQRLTLTADSKLANSAISAALADSPLKTVAFVDWFAYYALNPQYYTAPYFASDLFHLNDQGYAVLEGLVQRTFQSSFPSV